MPRLFQADGKLGRERHRATRRLFALVEQAALTAHFGEIAEIDGGRARRLASPANMLDREIEIAEVIGEQTHQIGRVACGPATPPAPAGKAVPRRPRARPDATLALGRWRSLHRKFLNYLRLPGLS